MKQTVGTQELQAVLNYLQTRPFAEVHVLIADLMKTVSPVVPVPLPPVEEKKDPFFNTDEIPF